MKKELPHPDTRIDLFYLVVFTRYNEKYGELLLIPTSMESHIYGIQATPACMARRRQYHRPICSNIS